MKGRQQEAIYAARSIREFLDGLGKDRDWDNFTSYSLRDPTLDSIRRRALAVDLPVDADGEATLKALQAEAEEEARRENGERSTIHGHGAIDAGMDRPLVTAVGLLALGAVLTVGASSLGLMGHYDAKVFVIAGGVLGMLLLLATGHWRRNGS